MIAELHSCGRGNIGQVSGGVGEPSIPHSDMCCSNCGGYANMKRMKLCHSCYMLLWYKRQPRCKFEGCRRHARAKGLCHAHYEQDRKGLELHAVRAKANAETDADPRAIRETLTQERKTFRREQLEYELRLAHDAYGCACSMSARLTMRADIVRIQSELKAFLDVISKGGA